MKLPIFFSFHNKLPQYLPETETHESNTQVSTEKIVSSECEIIKMRQSKYV